MKLKVKIDEKLKEKKNYYMITKQDILFSVGAMAAIGTLSRDNRGIVDTGEGGDMSVCRTLRWFLRMDIEQKAAIELAARDNIIELFPIEKTEVKPVIRR